MSEVAITGVLWQLGNNQCSNSRSGYNRLVRTDEL